MIHMLYFDCSYCSVSNIPYLQRLREKITNHNPTTPNLQSFTLQGPSDHHLPRSRSRHFRVDAELPKLQASHPGWSSRYDLSARPVKPWHAFGNTGSNEKKAWWLFRVYRGLYYPVLVVAYLCLKQLQNHMIQHDFTNDNISHWF